jgi:hypothetical protein
METAAVPRHAAQSDLLCSFDFDTALSHRFETGEKMPVRTQ